MARGASAAVQRALTADTVHERRVTEALVKCPMCGAFLEFDRRDPLNLGRTMQGCSSERCPDHPTRPVPVRRV